MLEQDNGSFSEPPELVEDTGKSDSVSGLVKNLLSTRKILALGSLLLVAVVILFAARPGDPTESKEYKDLQTEKAALQSKLSAIKAKVESVPDVSAEINLYELRIKRWNSALKAIGE
jgi:peptidoglycan hydrolase CwlO-like protein